jgi:predicted aspartyl protease
MPLAALHRSWLAVALTLASTPIPADEFDVTVPMHDKGLATYYVHAQIADLEASELMVDTGSGYLTINEQTLKALQERGQAQYVKNLRAILANGTDLVIPVYAISELRLGACTLRNVEAAVFPARTRQLLGLSALNKAAPFIFSIDPPKLVLSHCTGRHDALLAQPTLVESTGAPEPAGNRGDPIRPTGSNRGQTTIQQ